MCMADMSEWNVLHSHECFHLANDSVLGQKLPQQRALMLNVAVI